VIEGLYYFEFSDPNLNQEYVYGVGVFHRGGSA
jgi:hypothetical protein